MLNMAIIAYSEIKSDPMKYIFGFFQIMAYVYLCYFFVSVFLYTKKRTKNSKLILLTCMTLVLFTVVIIFIDKFAYKILIGSLITILFLWFIFDAKKMIIIFWYLMYMGIYLAIEYFILEMSKRLIPQAIEKLADDNMVASLFEIISLSVLFLCITFIRKIFGKHKTNVSINLSMMHWIMYLLIPIFTIISIVAILVNFSAIQIEGQEQSLLFISMGLCVMNIDIFLLLLNVEKREKRDAENNLTQVKARNQFDMYQMIEDRNANQTKHIHEFENHMSCISGLVSEKKYDELEIYVKEIENNLKESTVVFDTNNTIINTIINQKYAEAQENNIVFVIKTNDLKNFPLDKMETVIVLYNLINNAFEACKKCSNKIVKIKIMLYENNCLIAISNTYRDQPIVDNNKYVTTKDDPELHGVGIENIIDIVCRHNGIYTINVDKMFEFIIEIPLAYTKAKA